MPLNIYAGCCDRLYYLVRKYYIMKKILLSIVLFSGLCLSFLHPAADITEKERKDAIAYFKETKAMLHKQLVGLSEAQLNWKPADSVWSVANCVEHIAVTETGIFEWAMETLKTPTDSTLDISKKPTDEEVKLKTSDRSMKAKAPEMFVPSGRFASTSQAYMAFQSKRDSLVQYMKTTRDDLRGHYSNTFFGPTDVYQILLLLSGHTKRHTLQIAELKAMPGFPAK